MTSLNEQQLFENKLEEIIINSLRNHGIVHPVKNVIITEPPELVGEHFATVAVYVKVVFKDTLVKPMNLFVKRFSSNESQRQLVQELRLMDKEASFYIDFLPYARNFCSNYLRSENLLDCFSKCFYADKELVVLENLVLDHGFGMLSRDALQDLETAEVVLENLANYHAVSHAIISKEGLENFKSKWDLNVTESYDMSHPFILMFTTNGVKNCITIMENSKKEGRQPVIDFLNKFLVDLTKRIDKTFKEYPEEKFLVFGHGDCWNNNMLFKFEPNSKQIIRLVFVDLQATRLGSPNIDIGQYFFTSVKNFTRQTRLDDLLRHYFNQFQKTLGTLGATCRLTFEEFRQDYKRCCEFGFTIKLTMLSASSAYKDIDFTNIGNDEESIEIFNSFVRKWIEANPEKMDSIERDIISVVEEYKQLQNE